jgi:NAD(P)-dependent dehydrogenase (short-subunit alcohol dehydrogenase family)
MNALLTQDPAMGVTVIVGASGAIGQEVTSRLFSEGHRLVLAGRGAASASGLIEELLSHKHGEAENNERQIPTFINTDVSSDSGIQELIRELTHAGIPIRMLVFLPAAPTDGGISTASVEAILAAVNVKVGGLLRLTRGLTPLFVPGSAIVVVGGNLAYDPIPHAATSGIANAALANAVRQLQFPLGELGVRIHVVAPGPVDTNRWWQLAESEATKRGIGTEQVLQEASAGSALSRLTTVAEVAWTISTLADPLAASMTGSTFLLDAGRRTSSP